MACITGAPMTCMTGAEVFCMARPGNVSYSQR